MAAIVNPNGVFFRDQVNELLGQRMWWTLAAAIGTIGVLGVALAYVVTRPKPPPYVIEVNGKGELVARVEPVVGADSVPDAMIETDIRNFVENAFKIASDQGEERSYLKGAHDVVANQAELKMRTWYFGVSGKDKTNNPFTLGSSCWQEVTNVKVVKQPAPDTYFVHFTTIRHALNDGMPVSTNWYMVLKTAMQTDPQSGAPQFLITYLDFDKEG